MIPSIFQLAGAILLAILIFLRSDKQSVQASMTIITIHGQKNPKIKEIIKETWIIRNGLVLVIIGYLLQILSIDSQYLLDLTRLGKLIYTVIMSAILIVIAMFIANKTAEYKFKKMEPFNEDDDALPGAVMFKIEE